MICYTCTYAQCVLFFFVIYIYIYIIFLFITEVKSIEYQLKHNEMKTYIFVYFVCL
jgi:hypothetical protein